MAFDTSAWPQGPIEVDGSLGEGGGQILRTSLSLAALFGRPLRLDQIRAGRSKPGLLRQHLTAVRAIAEITRAEVKGAELRSQALRLRPGPIRGGDYHFAVGSAGSAMLVLQTVLWPLMLGADGASRVVVEGGTHNQKAPPFDFVDEVFLAGLRRGGASVSLTLERHGFFPAGGGRVVAEIEPSSLEPLHRMKAGSDFRVEAEVLYASISDKIAKRELSTLRRRLDLDRRAGRMRRVPSPGPGNVVMVRIRRGEAVEIISSFGARGRSAEDVAEQACADAEAFIASGAPVGEHLADQWVIPLALFGGAIRTKTPLSLHTRTNLELVT
ncbi:MAG: RNA 3'-terminal phosphate cyclase, partial [Myxococcota bacterium]